MFLGSVIDAIGASDCSTAPQAASLPLSALTAWQALFEHGHLVAGQRPQRPVTGVRRAAARVVAGVSRGTADLAHRLDDGIAV